MKFLNSVITGSGSFIPKEVIRNESFTNNPFYHESGQKIDQPGDAIIEKFEEITGIVERRYVKDQKASDIATIAAEKAIEDAGIDKESIDMIIVAHNFGDIHTSTRQSDMLPSLGSRVKQKLKIENPECIPHDMIFGCPGWVQAMIHAHVFIQSDQAKTCLVIGAETLSKMVDPFDRDTMIFADGAGAVILQRKDEDSKSGILSSASLSHTLEEADYLQMGPSFNMYSYDIMQYVKMKGRKIYEYALTKVPAAMKACLDKSGVSIDDLDKILIHQANEKMDEAIIKRFYRQYKIREVPEGIMPMTIAKLGNSSVATVPTLYDLITHGQLEPHNINKGDNILMASVGAGMNINAIMYRA